MSEMPPRVAMSESSACDKCRRLHRKCDLVQPRCGLCERTFQECTRSLRGLRFKRGLPHLGSGQGSEAPMLSPGRKTFTANEVRYVHETARIVRAHHPRRVSQAHSASLSPDSSMPTNSSRRWSSSDHAAEGTCESPELGNLLPEPAAAATTQLPSVNSLSSTFPKEVAFRPTLRCWTFEEPTQVLLFQHFLQRVSLFFDICDPEWHFAIEVTSRARLYPPLMDAILAVSASHMSLTGENIDPSLATKYYQRCLSVLIPELSTVQQDRVDNLLAATVILRLHEELDGPAVGLITYRHSVGTRALLQSQAAQVTSLSGFRRAAAWAGVRQEIYASIKLHRPPTIKASPEMLDHLNSSSSDAAWGDHVTNHCLEVLEFCFGGNSMNGELYDSLLDANARWEVERPASYDPLCFHAREDPEDSTDSFWDLRFHADWHANSWAYRSLARILLVVHNPRQPRVGLNRITKWDNVIKEVHYNIKLLCSIARSRASIPGPSLIACMAIWLAGDMVEDPREQKRVLAILASTEEVHGWPTRDLYAELTGLWSI